MRFFHPAVVRAAIGKMENHQLHYKPLNGRSLKDISLKKEHHGNGVFINPIGPLRGRRFLQLLKWKFSPSQFSPYLKDQSVHPIVINWSPIQAHQGVSVTFLKHAGVLIIV